MTFENGDMVAMIGNTVVERAQSYGHFETALSLAAKKRDMKFRNLAWSGDSVYGHARSYFGPPQEGFDRLKGDLTELKPNVVILCYGAVAAFDGEKGLPEFIKGYERLIDMISSAANPRVIVLLSPPPAENLGSPMPNMAAHNKNLDLYTKAIGELAQKKNLKFADLYNAIGTGGKGLTDNGIHFTEKGYHQIAPKFVRSLGLDPPNDKQLDSTSANKLRQLIVAKNRLFFHRWRPANETYLRLFRKHEQGQNAKELPMFDPIIAEREKEIEALKQNILQSK
ncbi:MAG: SGNH/GDSL hydrolase family protein [Akkermansiaceae bacterium]